jgi:Zn-dependent metalloprotease
MSIRLQCMAAAIASLATAAATPTLAAPAATPLMSPAAQQSPATTAQLTAILQSQHAAQGLDANHGVVFARQHPGTQGTQVSRFDQTYKGVRIFGADTVVVTDSSGKMVGVSASDRHLNLGKGAANRLGPSTADFDVTPVLSTKAAIDAALRTLPSGGAHQAPPTAELIIYPIIKTERLSTALTKNDSELNALDVRDVVDHYELAYLVHIRMHLGRKPLYYDTVVSARDGHVLHQWSMLQTVVGVGNSQYNGAVAINTTQQKDKSFQMIDASRGTGGTFGAMAITNANHTTSPGAVYTNASNTWGDGKQYVAGGSTTNANGQTAAVNALWGLMNTYDMLKGTLGWLSLDGHNTATYIAAHVNTAYDNAYYSDTCKCMFIGDGSSFYSLGAIDVIGHEMGHGVTAATSNLTYSGESGGLNESSSDINGEMVEAYARAGGTGAVIPGGNDWGVGKEISKTATPLRYMYKPSKDGNSMDAWSTSLKRLDVHYSSGPNNRMFYFLSQGSNGAANSDFYSKYLVKKPAAMSGIGNDKAYRIWFKAATTKFTASTNYADARAKMMQAAQELYGANSRELKAVQRAYAAINVGPDIDE